MPASDYTPGIVDVAGYIRSRTKTQGGAEAGTFNPAINWTDGSGTGTRPNAEQVSLEIEKSTGFLSATFGADVDDQYWGALGTLAALRAAMIVELTYFQEQVNSGRSTYPQLKELYDELYASLLSAMGLDDDGDGQPDNADPLSGMPSYGGFPTTAIGMEHPW
jgi:hypothetical protein